MKRLGILVLIVLFAVALMSACGQKEGETPATQQETEAKQAEMMDTTRMDSAAMMDSAGAMMDSAGAEMESEGGM
jgi:PBP1b-binding outer membrane lipoprotein LpoB